MSTKSTALLIKFKWLFVLLLIVESLQGHAQDEPRYNRIQYHKYNWRAYHTKTFHVYFPAGNDSLCAFTVKELPTAIALIKKRLVGANIKDISIIIYPSTDQQYETNIGAYEPQQYTLPTFVSKGGRIVLAYNGSYDDLKQQLYNALAQQVWETQLQDDNLEAQAKGTTKPTSKSSKNDIPDWYKEGAIRYLGNGWAIADEDMLRTSFVQNHFTGYQQVLAYEPKLAGLAFCYFLTERYMPTIVAQTFTQFKKKKSLTRVIRLVTKRTLDTLYSQCFNYYALRFKTDTSVKPATAVSKLTIPHRKGIVRNILISPAQDQVAYVDYYNNTRTIYVYDTILHKTHKIASYKLAPWIDDHSRDQYPLLQWHSGGQLFVAMPVKGRIQIRRYTTDGRLLETTKLFGVDGITAMQPEDNDNFVLAAYRKGQGDLVRYNDLKEKYTPFTDDSWDDSYPVLTGTKNGGELYFVSDRPKKNGPRIYLIGVGYKKDTLYQGIYHLKAGKLQPVVIDSVNYVKWDKPVAIPNDELLVTHTKYGIERFAVLDPFTSKVTTLEPSRPYQYLSGSGQIAFYKSGKDSVSVTEEPLHDWMERTKITKSDTTSPWLVDYRKRAVRQAKEDSILNKARDTTHTFLEQVLKAKPKKKKAAIKDSTDNSVIYDPKKTGAYILQLHSAYFTAKVNNDYFINRYQPYQSNQGEFKFPELGAMAQGGFTDVLENHHFTMAYRIPSATDGSLFFVKYENTTKKVDWGLSYFRDVETLQPDPNRNWVDENGNTYPNTAKVKTHYYELFFKDPINYDCAFGLETAVRQDATIFLATDKRSLDFAPYLSNWSITTLSYTMNKLHPTLPFLFKGVYVKAMVDGFKGFSQEGPALFGSTVDVAYHQPLYKYITLVTQVHAGYSAGQEKILYNLGGVDNNVTPRVDSSVHFAQNAPYAFQTLVTPFRGYYQNTLYGNEFLLFNADLYFPIFKTLIPIETPLPAINNLQLGIFSDAATAKETWNTTPNNKWLPSYGLSARTSLAGYPLRVDVAWPNNGKPPVWYFSLNL